MTSPGLEEDMLRPFPELSAYGEGLRRGEFLIPRCRDCGQAHWHPRPFCPFCHGANITAERALGGGTVYSHTVIRSVDSPYVLAYVTLDEGPSMLTNIVGSDVDAVAIGSRVVAVVEHGETAAACVRFALAPPAPRSPTEDSA